MKEGMMDEINEKNNCTDYNYKDPGGVPSQGICEHWHKAYADIFGFCKLGKICESEGAAYKDKRFYQ